jgi:hypothetical protein
MLTDDDDDDEDDDDDDDVVYSNPSVYDFLLTLDTQLTFVFQF